MVSLIELSSLMVEADKIMGLTAVIEICVVAMNTTNKATKMSPKKDRQWFTWLCS